MSTCDGETPEREDRGKRYANLGKGLRLAGKVVTRALGTAIGYLVARLLGL